VENKNVFVHVAAGPEVWAGFSVRDHCLQRAYVAELLLYDRLIIPAPPPTDPNDPESPWDPEAVGYWTRANWNPDKLRSVVRRLRNPKYDRVTVVDWDKSLRQRWKRQMQDVEEVLRSRHTAYDLTGTVLMASVSGQPFRAVTGYPSDAARFTRDTAREGLVPSLEAADAVPPRQHDLALRLGARFLLPDASGRTDEYALDQALELSSSPEFAAKRREFYAWLNGLPVDRLTDEAVLGQAEAALEAWNALVRQAGKTPRHKFVFFTVRLMPAIAGLAGVAAGIDPVTAAAATCALEVVSCATDFRDEPERPHGPTPGPMIAAAREALVPVGPIRALTSQARYQRWRLAERLTD
jgi:hypothetical protein